MREVSKKEFYDFFEKLPGVHTIAMKSNEWHVLQNGVLIAKAVEQIGTDEEKYFIAPPSSEG